VTVPTAEYDAEKHGISQWMTMLDDIDALREEEQEARNGTDEAG
jgi:hypothetical protein